MKKIFGLVVSFFAILGLTLIDLISYLCDKLSSLLDLMFIMLATGFFIKLTGLSFWWGGVFLASMGVLLYLSSNYLLIRFIQKNAPNTFESDVARGKSLNDGEYLWEKTAGLGIVPRWVSRIGKVSLLCFVGMIIWFIAAWVM